MKQSTKEIIVAVVIVWVLIFAPKLKEAWTGISVNEQGQYTKDEFTLLSKTDQTGDTTCITAPGRIPLVIVDGKCQKKELK